MTPEEFINSTKSADIKIIFQSFYAQHGEEFTSCFTLRNKSDRDTVLCKTGNQL
jgi:hypothetical protein